MFGMFKPDLAAKVDRLAKDGVTFIGLIQLAANQIGLSSKLLVQEVYAFPVSHFNQAVTALGGDDSYLRELRKGLQLYLGVACYSAHFGNGRVDLHSPEVSSFIKRFTDLSEEQCRQHLNLRQAYRDNRALPIDRESETVVLVTFMRFFSKSADAERYGELSPWFRGAWSDFDRMTHAYLKKHCLRP